MNCERTRALLGAHLDGELDAVNEQELQAHLRECPLCLSAASSQKTVQRMVRNVVPYHHAPSALESRVRASLRGQTHTGRQLESSDAPALRLEPRNLRWLAFAATAAAVLVALWIGSAVTARQAASDLLAEEVVSAHVRSMQGSHLMDVTSSDQHTVKPWFDGKVDFAPPVHDLAAEGFPLLGGRLDYVAGHSAAALVFQHNKHFINVFIWPSGAAMAAHNLPVDRRGYNFVWWRQGDLTFCAVSDLNRTELTSFSSSYRAK